MVRNHIKRLAAPKTWPIHRKAYSWIAKPSSGTHSLDSCVSIGTFLKNEAKISLNLFPEDSFSSCSKSSTNCKKSILSRELMLI